jgi:hypothetical protein
VTVVVDAREDFTLEAFRRVAVDGEGVVFGPTALRVMGEEGYAGSTPASCCTPSTRLNVMAFRFMPFSSAWPSTGYVGGQEDMLIDVALQLAREREAAGTPA